MSKDNVGREWSGDASRQHQMANAIMTAFRNYPTVDVMGAVETVMANIICDLSPNREEALKGLQACMDDMIANVVNQRFPAPPQH